MARAKAGIIKPGGDVVIYGGVPEADRIFEETCRARGARLHRTPLSDVVLHQSDLAHCSFDFGRYRNIVLPLAGTYQPNNAAVAVTALEVLRKKGFPLRDEDILSGLARVKWPGRFELLRRNPIFLLDGAHNPHGVKATAESLRANFGDEKLVFLTGVMADKDISHMIPPLAPLAKHFVTVTPDNPRALPAADYAKMLADEGLPATAAATIPEGVRLAAELAGPEGAVCALGSLYFSEDVRRAVFQL